MSDLLKRIIYCIWEFAWISMEKTGKIASKMILDGRLKVDQLDVILSFDGHKRLRVINENREVRYCFSDAPRH